MSIIRPATCVAFVTVLATGVPAFAGDVSPGLKRATARACVQEGRDQGLVVNRVGKVEIVRGDAGRVIGTQTTLSVKREGQSYFVHCNYTLADGAARIASAA